MSATPVIAVFDVGKTNKKLFLFDEDYRIVFERTARFTETADEDGFPCENIESLRLSLFDSLTEIFRQKEFVVKAINFSAYGASFVMIGRDGLPKCPLYNYLKPYPDGLDSKLYAKYGGKEPFSVQTASPPLGNLNSGLQLYRLKEEKPNLYKDIKYALHLPQYLSFLLTGEYCSDLTSIGCHTALWDFEQNRYHEWVQQEGIIAKLAPIEATNKTYSALSPGSNYAIGTGLHDSSAALIPYLVNFTEPFVLISTGTWCISLNPFNHTPLTADMLKQDCLSYLDYQGKPVMASRLFSGFEHEQQVKRIAEHFDIDALIFKTMPFDRDMMRRLKATIQAETSFAERELSTFANEAEAYHQFVTDLVRAQVNSTSLVFTDAPVKRIFVDGGFSKNSIFMNLLALAFPHIEVFAASMAQASALGAALVLHKKWNTKPIPNDIIELKYYSASQGMLL
ncbi:FGGY-family carbohydrate kinase [Mucilaginibacter psychrotolerans]|uniref:Carbohydrate kinase n=1 Tax=Mucilaginibacter psychrotolerans TaxID=1524096 RepID=A0A4Y8S6D9_9SPHI|nr:FGGY family carbohydrate kinase [Mucilaginibacter psychrotolerans]TFF34492.1 carbohydrate kinase [Mucilaginibacter psychrotolerans]